MTLEWMFGPEAEAVSAVPRTAWLENGSLLLYDVRRPEKERALVIHDARGGTRAAVDVAKALENLKAVIGEKGPQVTLPWPDGISAPGTRALYTLTGRVCVLDLPSAEFRAIPGDREEVRAARLSPDGRRVAYVRGNDLWTWDFERGQAKRMTHDGSDTILNGAFSWVYWEEIFNHEESAFWWSPDSRSIAFLRTDESKVPEHSFTAFEPFEPKVITQRYPKAGQTNPEVRLGIVSIDSGRTVWMSVQPPAYEYVVRVTWLPSSGALGIQTLNRAQTELSFFRVDPGTGVATGILFEKDAAGVQFYDPLFTRDGKQFLWVSDRSGYAQIYRYAIDGQLMNQVTEGEWSVWPWGMYSGGHSGLTALDEKGGWVYFTARAKSLFPGRQVYRARLGGGSLERVSNEDGDHWATFSPDCSRYVDVHSRASQPPSLSLHTVDGGPAKELAGARLDLVTPLGMRFPDFFTLPASDGTRLPAQVSRPHDFDPAKKYPVIFYVYGGPGAPSVLDAWNPNGWSQSVYFDQMLLDRGYVVVSVDNRSSAAIGKKFERMVQGQLYGNVELHDIESAVNWAKAQPWVDPERLGVWGWSGGGTATLLAMTGTTAFKAGIAVAPVTDWRYYDTRYAEFTMKTPADNPAGYEQTSLVKRAKDLRGRLLLVHGTGDDNVHPQNSLAFMNALIEAGLPFDCMVYPMRKHIIPDVPAKLHLYRTMLEFWKRSL